MKSLKAKKYFRINTLFTLLIILMLVVMFLLNTITLILSNRYPLSIDLTANSAYKIGDETKTILGSLTDDINIYVLATADSFEGSSYLIQARNIIDQYPVYSNSINLEYIDFEANPTFAAGYPELTLSAGNILVTRGDRVKQITLSSMFNYTYTTSGASAIESSRAEETITSSILNVISEDQVSIAVLSGNGVSDMPAFLSLLSDNNFTVTNVNMATETFDEYNLCILFAPTVDLSEDVLQKLDDFLYNNGAYGKTLLYTADVAQPELPNLESFLGEWGIIVGDGAIFETTEERTYNYQPYYPIVEYTNNTYKDKVKDSDSPLLMPLSRPLSVLYETKDRQYTETLLSFFETAGVRPSDAEDTFTASQATKWGPMPAFVLASRRILDTTGMTQFRSNVIVSASTFMFDASTLQNSSLTNSEYILNLFNDVTERTDTVNIKPKSLSGNTLGITSSQSTRLGVILCGIVPLIILSAGIVIWLLRRYK